MSSAKARRRTAILISGRGSNMLALVEAAKAADYPAEIALVLSNVPGAGGLERAAPQGVATATVDHRAFAKDREAFERAMDEVLRVNQIELVALAGFMRILTPWFVQRWQGRLINIHPSLLPLFKGTHTHRQALKASATEHGCSVHFVLAELDGGPVIAQTRVPVLPGDDEDALAQRVLGVEHALYIAALAEVAAGTVWLDGGVALRA